MRRGRAAAPIQGEHDAGQHGMRDGVAHQRPALQHEIAGQHRADRRDQERHHQRALHERIRERRDSQSISVFMPRPRRRGKAPADGKKAVSGAK